jgi:hypothetical protein
MKLTRPELQRFVLCVRKTELLRAALQHRCSLVSKEPPKEALESLARCDYALGLLADGLSISRERLAKCQAAQRRNLNRMLDSLDGVISMGVIIKDLHTPKEKPFDPSVN